MGAKPEKNLSDKITISRAMRAVRRFRFGAEKADSLSGWPPELLEDLAAESLYGNGPRHQVWINNVGG